MVHTHQLGGFKASSEWWTPPHIWDIVRKVIGGNIYDPFPTNGLVAGDFHDGLTADWVHNVTEYEYSSIYCNPPIPAAVAAQKCLDFNKVSTTPVIFAAYSIDCIIQVPELQDHLICWVRNRISWVDGNVWKALTAKELKEFYLIENPESRKYVYNKESDKWYKPNPGYLKPAKSPPNYSAFVLLCSDNDYGTKDAFNTAFSNLGTVRQSHSYQL